MITPWGNLGDLDLTDHRLCEAILAEDKHQLGEGLVVENIFDQIIEAIPVSLADAILIDVETAIADTGRQPDRWHAFVWARTREKGLGRYLSTLERKFRTWLIELDDAAGTFMIREWKDGKTVGAWQPLATIMEELSRRVPRSLRISSAVRDSHRQKLSYWGYLVDSHGDQLGARVVLPRLFFNHGIQPWFRAVWNLDRILVESENIWMLEIKHKFPFGGSELRFGINEGELGVIRLLGEAGVRCFHAILAKPTWTKESGSGYLLNRLQLRERAALIGVELAIPVVQAMFAGRQGFSPEHTTFSGKGKLKYRPLAANRFRKIGMMSELHGTLAANLARVLAGDTLPQVSDQWLRSLRAEQIRRPAGT